MEPPRSLSDRQPQAKPVKWVRTITIQKCERVRGSDRGGLGGKPMVVTFVEVAYRTEAAKAASKLTTSEPVSVQV